MIILFNLIVLCNSLHLQHLFEKIYHDDSQLQQIVNNITSYTQQDSPLLFKKQLCKNDQSYSSIIIQPVLKNQKVLNVIIICNIHARQVITSEVCINFIQTLKQLSKSKKLDNELSKHSQISSVLLNSFSYQIFYRANNNRDNALKVDHCIRKNKNNVDENRNFPTQFNIENQSPDSQIYGGLSPISQPFTECLSGSIQKKTLDVFIDIHSGEVALYYQQKIDKENHDDQNEINIIKQIVKNGGLCEKCRVTTLKKDGQTINGHIFADLKVRKNIKYSILVQIYNGAVQTKMTKQQICYSQFNPTTNEQKIRTIEKWNKILIQMLYQIEEKQKYKN